MEFLTEWMKDGGVQEEEREREKAPVPSLKWWPKWYANANIHTGNDCELCKWEQHRKESEQECHHILTLPRCQQPKHQSLIRLAIATSRLGDANMPLRTYWYMFLQRARMWYYWKVGGWIVKKKETELVRWKRDDEAMKEDLHNK